MNCQQGDLARYVGRDPKCYGFIVTCVGLLNVSGVPYWVTSPDLPLEDGTPALATADSVLRPLRPRAGDDETLAWAGKPQQHDETLKPKRQVEHSR